MRIEIVPMDRVAKLGKVTRRDLVIGNTPKLTYM